MLAAAHGIAPSMETMSSQTPFYRRRPCALIVHGRCTWNEDSPAGIEGVVLELVLRIVVDVDGRALFGR